MAWFRSHQPALNSHHSKFKQNYFTQNPARDVHKPHIQGLIISTQYTQLFKENVAFSVSYKWFNLPYEPSLLSRKEFMLKCLNIPSLSSPRLPGSNKGFLVVTVEVGMWRFPSQPARWLFIDIEECFPLVHLLSASNLLQTPGARIPQVCSFSVHQGLGSS